MKQLKGDNRGLSLIEVLVAVVILGIVVTPFLHSFITSATSNSKAKNIHKATVVAQSVMEGVKAESLENIAMQFDYPGQGFYVLASGRIGDGTNVESLVGELCAGASGGYVDAVKYEDPSLDGLTDKRAGVTAGTYSEDMGATGEFLGQPGGIYYFYLEDVKEDTSSYDVLVKLDATAYRAGGSVEATHQYNAVELTQLPVVDLDQDAVCVQKETYTDAAVEHFLATHSTTLTADDLRDGLARTTTISVERVLVGTEYKTMVTTEYLYSYESGGETWEYLKTRNSFDSLETGKDLRSVYLYYYPLYANDIARDEIIFKNNSGLPVDFYLMKQKSSTVTSDNEEQYRMLLKFDESGATESTMQTRLHTNLATNLTSGNEIAVPLFTVTLNGGTINLDNITSDKMLDINAEDRMFDIEVSVYEKGAKDAGFPEDMRLTTMEGNKVY